MSDANTAVLSQEAWSDTFLAKRELKGLRDRLLRILPAAKREDQRADLFLEDVLTSCYGAYRFELEKDWRTINREHYDSFLKAKATAARNAQALQDFIDQHPNQIEWMSGQCAQWVEQDFGVEMPQMYLCRSAGEETRQASFVYFLGALLVSFSKTLTDEIGLFRMYEDSNIHGVAEHGPLALKRRVRGDKVRETRQLLAFDLEWMLREASVGVIRGEDKEWKQFGRRWHANSRMPQTGKSAPHRNLIVDLVIATLGEKPTRADGRETAITAEWVNTSVRSILRDNPEITILAWPGSTFPRHFEHTNVPSKNR